MIIVLAKGQQKRRREQIHIDYSKVTLEKGIPLPTKKHSGRPRKDTTPYKYMSIGDCFFVPTKTDAVNQSILKRGYRVAKKLGIKVTGRTSKEGVRVWRVK